MRLAVPIIPDGRRILVSAGRALLIHAIVIEIPIIKFREYTPDCSVVIARVNIRPKILVQITVDRRFVPYGADSRPGGDPAFQFLGHKQQEHTVISASTAYAPILKKAYRIFISIHTVQVFNGHDENLRAVTVHLQFFVSDNNVIPRNICQYICGICDVIVRTLGDKRQRSRCDDGRQQQDNKYGCNE